jgi:glycerol-3-phosphate dehydrogenase
VRGSESDILRAMGSTEVVVIRAGVVGLIVARALAQRGRETIVLELHARPAGEATSPNAGAIHSGIYYPVRSLKARAVMAVGARRATLLWDPHARSGMVRLPGFASQSTASSPGCPYSRARQSC